ncbi:hypothetical protein L7F22_052656 [Adiantum nelumboides]|nr:hypothetical protein [Adiantum nelumboides]
MNGMGAGNTVPGIGFTSVGLTGIGSNGGGSHAGAASGLPPAPSKLDANQAQSYRLQDAYWSDEDEDMECPLCLEEIDISDANFKPCPCGYQICRFCWHHIKSNLNGRCPACRRKYSDTMVEFKAMSQDEIKKLSLAKKQKEREKRELEQMNRKHLANMRVVQKNLVYVVGMDPKLAREELIPTLRSNEYFGQYGRISKILISKRTTASKLIMGTHESSIGIYVTYVRKEDAARAIIAIDGSKGDDGRTVRASYGTTKYCTTYLRNLPCTNPICTYLHEPGEEADSFTKEDLTTLRHAAKDAENRIRPTPTPSSFHAASRTTQDVASNAVGSTGGGTTVGTPGIASTITSASDGAEGSALPKTASWASGKPIQSTPTSGIQSTNGNAIRDAELPPLSALVSTPNSRKGSLNRVPGAQGSPSLAKATIEASSINRNRVRAESPAPPRSATASPVPTAPPGLSKAPQAMVTPTKPSAGTLSRTNSTKELGNEESTRAAAGAPPGLSRHGAPPGLTTSRSATPSADTASTHSEPKTSNYQLSSNAQAILDDMRARRDAEASQPVKNLFAAFDATLSTFRDGDDFCFTLEESSLPSHLRNTAGSESKIGGNAIDMFTPFSTASAFASIASSTGPPPGLGGENGTRSASKAYSGTFDPFASSIDEKLSNGKLGLREDSSPFAAIDEMRRTLSEERQPTAEELEDEENNASRFGFAKRKGSFKTSDDLIGFVKGGSLLGNNETSSSMNNVNSTGLDSYLHAQNQNLNNVTQSNILSAMSGFSGNAGGDWSQGLSGGQQMQQRNVNPLSSILSMQNPNGGNNYTTSDRSYFGNQAGMNRVNPGTPGADSILLAQLMNRKPADGMPYNDPAIMSFTRQQQQQQLQQQQQQQQAQQQSANANSSAFGAFNPFDGQMFNSGSFGPASNYQQQNQQQSQQQQQQNQPFGGHRAFA